MKKISTIITCMLLAGNLFAAVNWDILDKTMNPWNADGGAATNKAWTFFKGSNTPATGIVTQKTGYVNIKKTDTDQSNIYAWIRPAATLVDLTSGMAYSVEVKARVQEIDRTSFPDDASYYEANQIALRMGGFNAPIFLKYGNGASGGYVSATSGGTANVYAVNTSQWQVYRIVFHADHSQYDVYIDGVEEPVFENIAVVATSDRNGIYVGAESKHRCNIDIEYVKMGRGDFFSKSKIVSVALSAESQAEENERTITVTANTSLVYDNEKLLFSLIDGNENTVGSVVEARISAGKAEANLTIPAGLSRGKYFVKAAAPNGKIGDVNITPQKAEYLITSSVFEGKKLITFGNSITEAANSWAYQTYRKLRFADLYNGAIGGAIWYKRARKAQDGDSIWTQDYSDIAFAGMSNETNSNRVAFQRIINNCAVVHIQKYIIDNPKASPDYAILSYGTNDVTGDAGSVAGTMAKESNKVNLFTIAGALRWSIETLRTKFPKLVIYVALPIQAKDASKNSGNRQKIQVIKGICDAMSVPYFDCYNESGITVENQDAYLRDGLHPNEAGKVVHGEYIIKKLEEAEAGRSAVVQEKVRNECISISGNVLDAGESLFVKTMREDASLTEMTLYGMAGNTVCRKAVSGNECTFNVPAVAGMYLLTVRLADNTSKEFKILVK